MNGPTSRLLTLVREYVQQIDELRHLSGRRDFRADRDTIMNELRGLRNALPLPADGILPFIPDSPDSPDSQPDPSDTSSNDTVSTYYDSDSSENIIPVITDDDEGIMSGEN